MQSYCIMRVMVVFYDYESVGKYNHSCLLIVRVRIIRDIITNEKTKKNKKG